MTMVSYLFRMPSGIPGDVVSSEGAFIEPQEITAAGQADAPDAYGIPVVLDASTGKVRKVKSTDTGIRGLLVRAYPTAAAQEGLGVASPPTSGACDVLRRGKMSIKLTGSAAAVKGAPVYVWKSAASGTHIVGGFEAADPSSDGFVLPDTTFDGPADADGITTISYNI